MDFRSARRRLPPGLATAWRFALYFSAVSLFGLSCAGEPGPDASSGAGDGPETHSGVLLSPTPAGPLVGPDGATIMLMPPDPGYVPPTDPDAAIEAASPHISTSIGPSSISVALAIFGSGDHVWVVTFDGICASVSAGPPPGSGHTDCPITSANAVVDADTGAWTSTYWGSRQPS